MKPQVGTEFCMHAHVGFLARGQIHMEFPDGCVLDFQRSAGALHRAGPRRMSSSATSRPWSLNLISAARPSASWACPRSTRTATEFSFDTSSARLVVGRPACANCAHWLYSGFPTPRSCRELAVVQVEDNHFVGSHLQPRRRHKQCLLRANVPKPSQQSVH